MSYSIIPLFAIPLYQSTIPPISKDMFDKLVGREYEVYDGVKVTHEETAERFILNRPEFADLKRVIDSKIAEYVHEALGVNNTFTWEITTSWVNKAKPGDWHANHWHSNSLISGVVYLKTNPKTGVVCFHKGERYYNMFNETFGIEFDKETDYSTPTIGVVPSTHTILMFPSHLAHSVCENESTETRYSLAFNVFPRGTVGQGGNSELTL
jgi:uncharacterized protein (TIGR02466 family)